MNQDYYSKISTQMYFYGAVVIVPCGFLLNFVQYIVYSHKNFQKSNIGFLMKLLTAAETLALIWNILVFRYLRLIGLDLSLVSNFSCAIFYFMARTVQETPFFFQAFIAFVNYLSVSCPSKYLVFKKSGNLWLCFILIVAVVSFINIPNTFRYLSENSNQTLNCNISYQMNILSTIEFSLMRNVVPLVLMSIMNALTIRALINPRVLLNFSIRNEIKFAKTILMLGVVFILFGLPFSLTQIALIVYEFVYNFSQDSVTFIHVSFISDCARIWAFSYYGMGCFISVLFNKLFRKSAIDIVNNVKNRSRRIFCENKL